MIDVEQIKAASVQAQKNLRDEFIKILAADIEYAASCGRESASLSFCDEIEHLCDVDMGDREIHDFSVLKQEHQREIVKYFQQKGFKVDLMPPNAIVGCPGRVQVQW